MGVTVPWLLRVLGGCLGLVKAGPQKWGLHIQPYQRKGSRHLRQRLNPGGSRGIITTLKGRRETHRSVRPRWREWCRLVSGLRLVRWRRWALRQRLESHTECCDLGRGVADGLWDIWGQGQDIERHKGLSQKEMEVQKLTMGRAEA